MGQRSRADRPTGSLAVSPYVEVHGPWVRYLRKDRDLEIAELADMIGVSAAHLRKMELGYSPRTSITVYRALRDALGLSSEDGAFIRGNPWGTGADLDDTAPAGDAA